MSDKPQSKLSTPDMLLLWLAFALWLAVLLVGTLVASEPFRMGFADFDRGVAAVIQDGLLVLITYTFTNVAILCVLAGVLGALGAKAILVSDKQGEKVAVPDTTSPRSSAVLRSFFVYLALIAGVLFLGENPAEPTQNHYVRLAGTISLAAFVVNYRPKIFGRVLERASRLFGDTKPPT